MKIYKLMLTLIFVLAITIIICLTVGRVHEQNMEVQKLEAARGCWSKDFIPPYVYDKHNSCTGEGSEEISKAYKKLYDRQQLKLDSKNALQ